MQTIRFIPDRLNTEAVVFRGFTTPEMGLAALAGVGLGAVWPLPLIPLAGWVMLPTGMLITPLIVVAFGGKWLAAKKRGKPENYIWQRLAFHLRRLHLGHATLIMEAQGWSLKRSRRMTGGAS